MNTVKLFLNKISGEFSLILYILIASTQTSAAQQNPSPLLTEARQKMPKAFESEMVCQDLYDKLKTVKNPDTILKGYIGGVNIAMSKHAPLFDKRGYLITGTELLDAAIREKPNTTELLFLRLTIQLNLPSFLGYNDNIDEDKKFIFENYETAPPYLKERITNFIKKSDHFTEEEKARIK